LVIREKGRCRSRSVTGETSSPDHDVNNTAGSTINSKPEVIVSSREVEIHALYRAQVTERLSQLERYNSGVTRYEVGVDHELNPRQSKTSHRVTITGLGTGPNVHAEASGSDLRDALDGAVGKLEERLRRRRDRRRVRNNRAHRAIDPGRESTLHLVVDDTSSTPQPGSSLTSPGAGPLSSRTD
jgi:ribosomal subunit interface protein